MAGTERQSEGCSCTIADDIWLALPPSRVFAALTRADDLARWWPMAAESEPRTGGALALTWFSGQTMRTSFETFEPGREVSFAFYSEHVAFSLAPETSGTRFRVTHRCGTDDAIHVAQSWGFLKASLKAFLEGGMDLRDRPLHRATQ
jgi:uncharacterized protein YndB with AHSA1/START domain